MAQQADRNPKILTVREVSDYLKIPLSTLYELTQKGKIKASKVGRHWRYLEEDILNYLHGSESRETCFDERRRHPRINTETRALLRILLYSKNGSGKEGVVTNVSEGGMRFVFSAEASRILAPEAGVFCEAEVGDPVRVLFTMGGEKNKALELDGRVVHKFKNGSISVGIKFKNISPEDRAFIREYVG